MAWQRKADWLGIGHSLDYLKDPLGFLEHLHQTAGDVASLRIFGQRALVLYHPRHIEQVLTAHASKSVKGFRSLRQQSPFGQGLLMSDGDLWRRQRRLVQQVYQPRGLRSIAVTMANVAQAHLVTWQDGMVIDVLNEMSQVSLQAFLQTLIGPDFDHTPVVPIFERLNSLFQHMTSRPVPVPLWIPIPSNRRMIATLRSLDLAIADAIMWRRAQPGDDLLSGLLHAADADGPMSPERLHDEVKSLFLAGHETNALALCYALWLLAQDKDVQETLAADARMMEPSGSAGLGFSARVIQEAMRLYPPVHAMVREALVDDVIEGTPVRAGTQIVLPQWNVHRDARWWSSPLTFNPARWESGAAQRPRFAYFPFGGGERLCVGNHFALQMLTITLATIIRHWRVELVTPQHLDLQAGITLRPKHPVMLRVSRR